MKIPLYLPVYINTQTHTCTGVMRSGKHGQTSALTGERDGCQSHPNDIVKQKDLFRSGTVLHGPSVSYLMRL